MKKETHKQITWTSKSSFLIAAIGSSVGLGNVWKFPYEMGLNGGAAFLYIYIPCLLLVAFPLMVAEVMLGRYGRNNPVRAINRIALKERAAAPWSGIGMLAMFSGFIIFSYYGVVASWVLFYIMESLSGGFVDMPAELVQHKFSGLLSNTTQLILWHSVFVLMVIAVLSKGLRLGIERILMLFMPCLILLIVLLCSYAMKVGDFEKAYQFMFVLDASKITIPVFVSAITHAFFTLGIGVGVLLVYGSYMRAERPILTLTGSILLFNTAVALVMGLLIFSIAFAFDMRPDSGMGLIFQTLPVAFSVMDNSLYLSSAFFILLFVATLVSACALLEPLVAWWSEEFRINRRTASWIVGFTGWLSGLLCVLSFSELNFHFYYFNVEQKNGAFDLFNVLSTNILMPLTALCIALFAGWVINQESAQRETSIRFNFQFRIWYFAIKYIVPFVLVILLLCVSFYE